MGLIEHVKLSFRSRLRRILRVSTVRIDGDLISFPPVAEEVRDAIYREFYEATERALLRSIIRRGDRVMEVGGAIGFVSLGIARIAADLRVYEANSALIQFIEKNFRQNRKRCDVVCAAIVPDSHIGENVEFGIGTAFWSSSIKERTNEQERISVPAVRISDAVADFAPTVIVMDVEGAEVEILQSCPLDGVRLICVELHARITGRKPQMDMIHHLSEIGFEIDFERSAREVVTLVRP